MQRLFALCMPVVAAGLLACSKERAATPAPAPAPVKQAQGSAPPPGPMATLFPGRTVKVAAAGDVSAPVLDAQVETARLVEQGGYDAVLLLGDLQYPNGALTLFQQFFHPTWGRFFDRLYPSPGNHEYLTPGAAGYFQYFGARAGDPQRGYYSVDLGGWHVVSLNTNGKCQDVPCGEGSAQLAWLQADLAKNQKPCVLAYWHHPRFNSGSTHGSFEGARALWQVLHQAGAEVVLAGHEHVYERFEPQDADGRPAADGPRQFTVGTGGIGHYAFGPPLPNSAAREATRFGVLSLELRPRGYAWEFVSTEPGGLKDVGQGECR